jgi:hypothetical protein
MHKNPMRMRQKKIFHSKGYATEKSPINRTVSNLTAGSDMQEIL